MLQGKKLIFGCLKLTLQILCPLLHCINTLEFCDLLASLIVVPKNELPEKMFITDTTKAHGFSQFCSNEFEVYWGPMSWDQ